MILAFEYYNDKRQSNYFTSFKTVLYAYISLAAERNMFYGDYNDYIGTRALHNVGMHMLYRLIIIIIIVQTKAEINRNYTHNNED